MLCYHRTWWRRWRKEEKREKHRVRWKENLLVERESDERKMLCMVVEREKRLSSLVLVASNKVVVTLWYFVLHQLENIVYETNLASRRSRESCASGCQNKYNDRLRIFHSRRGKVTGGKSFFSNSYKRKCEKKFQFSFVCRSVNIKNERKQLNFYTSYQKCVVHRCVREKENYSKPYLSGNLFNFSATSWNFTMKIHLILKNNSKLN